MPLRIVPAEEALHLLVSSLIYAWVDLFMATSIYRCIFCLIPIILLWQESLHYIKFLSAKFNFYEFKWLERNDKLKRARI